MNRPDLETCGREEMVAYVRHLEQLLGAGLERDAGSARRGDPGTSKAAAASVPGAGTLRRRVLEVIVASESEGMTGDQVCAVFPDRRSDSVRPRIGELIPTFVRVLEGVTRPGDSGKLQQVYVATPSGRAAVPLAVPRVVALPPVVQPGASLFDLPAVRDTRSPYDPEANR
jgi:hypothetical protein